MLSFFFGLAAAYAVDCKTDLIFYRPSVQRREYPSGFKVPGPKQLKAQALGELDEETSDLAAKDIDALSLPSLVLWMHQFSYVDGRREAKTKEHRWHAVFTRAADRLASQPQFLVDHLQDVRAIVANVKYARRDLRGSLKLQEALVRLSDDRGPLADYRLEILRGYTEDLARMRFDLTAEQELELRRLTARWLMATLVQCDPLNHLTFIATLVGEQIENYLDAPSPQTLRYIRFLADLWPKQYDFASDRIPAEELQSLATIANWLLKTDRERKLSPGSLLSPHAHSMAEALAYLSK